MKIIIITIIIMRIKNGACTAALVECEKTYSAQQVHGHRLDPTAAVCAFYFR